MLALNDHDDGLRTEDLHQGVRYLLGEALLDLGALSVHIRQAGELAQAGDVAVFARDITNMRHAVKRHQMVLAGGIDGDIAHQN